MARNGPLHTYPMLRLYAEMRAKRCNMVRDTGLFVAVDLCFACARNCQDRSDILYGQTNTAKAIIAGARDIKKAKVKTSRDFYRDGFRHLLILHNLKNRALHYDIVFRTRRKRDEQRSGGLAND